MKTLRRLWDIVAAVLIYGLLGTLSDEARDMLSRETRRQVAATRGESTEADLTPAWMEHG